MTPTLARQMVDQLNKTPLKTYNEIAETLGLHPQTVANAGSLLTCLGLAPKRKRGGMHRPVRVGPTTAQAKLLHRARNMRRRGYTWPSIAEELNVSQAALYTLHRRFPEAA